jgi:hypothetical protein
MEIAYAVESPPTVFNDETQQYDEGTVVVEGVMTLDRLDQPREDIDPGVVFWDLGTDAVKWAGGRLLEPGAVVMVYRNRPFDDSQNSGNASGPVEDCLLFPVPPPVCPAAPNLIRPCADFASRITGLPEVIGNERGTTFPVDAQVANGGPDATNGELTFAGLSPDPLFEYQPCAPCPVPVLAGGASHLLEGGEVRLLRSVRPGDLVAPGLVGLSAIGIAGVPDPNNANDRHDTQVRVASPGDSSANRPREPVTQFSGRANGASGAQAGAAQTSLDRRIGALGKVEVALLRTSSRKCSWLRNRRLRFVRRAPAAGRCERPVWLRAKGTRRWRYSLRKRLPRGRYVLLSRATSKAGISETSFSRRDRNRIAFRVRGRRR